MKEQIANWLGPVAARALCEALMVNTTLTALSLGGEKNLTNPSKENGKSNPNRQQVS